MDKDKLLTTSRQLNSHVDTDSEEFARALEEANPTGKLRFSLTVFLVLQSKLRKQPPEIEVALLSLTEEERQRFTDFFVKWQETYPQIASAQELRGMLVQLGHPMPLEQARKQLQLAEVDTSKAMSLNEFLYILVTLGAGSSDRSRRILLPGTSYEHAFRQGFSLEELWELGFEDLVQIRTAGWSAQSVVKAGLAETWQLRQVGYSAAQLRKIGWSAKQMKLAGFSLEELRNAGYSSAALRECVTMLSRNRVHRFDEESALFTRPPEHVPPGPHPMGAIFDSGAQFGEKRWWATPRIKTMLDGPAGAKGLPGPKRSSVRARPVTR